MVNLHYQKVKWTLRISANITQFAGSCITKHILGANLGLNNNTWVDANFLKIKLS
ncbi:hypothetical protein J6TS1_49810 [Siminovitchia terrae]|uniref:Uncharacterized protein n=1 Tax=Siminovitchia terrae TaxID=1914933 RepID=A0ABQ4L4R0_SIMTE|nr:hypothetical protein J22TS1_29690 [Siminovitchia terrae]GIN99111.1 hypothetical protein J6TS1_49810 [Siminovitchia terrae]